MRARVVTLRFDPVLQAFDDAPLQEVLKAREVFSIRDHFFMRNEVPYLVVVTYGLKPPVAEPALPEKVGGRKGSWRALVSEADLPLFDALRDWRAERARREGRRRQNLETCTEIGSTMLQGACCLSWGLGGGDIGVATRALESVQAIDPGRIG